MLTARVGWPSSLREMTYASVGSWMVIDGVTRRKQHRPGIAPNANTTHVPTAGSSAALTKPNHTPTPHPRAKGKILLLVIDGVMHPWQGVTKVSTSTDVNRTVRFSDRLQRRDTSCNRVGPDDLPPLAAFAIHAILA